MRTPSRFMPQFPEEKSNPVVGWLFAAAFFGALGALLVTYPIVFGPLFAVMAIAVALEKRRFKRLVSSRGGESICTFARSVNARSLDTHVVRAVYEELGNVLGSRSALFPLRPSDKLFARDGLNLESDDLEELLVAIAFRANRSLESTQSNPYFGKVQTVSDLIQFLIAQPEVARA